MKNQNNSGAWIGTAIGFSIVMGGITGWIWNIVKLAHADFGHVTGMLALRCIGVIVAPLGSVLGFC